MASGEVRRDSPWVEKVWTGRFLNVVGEVGSMARERFPIMPATCGQCNRPTYVSDVVEAGFIHGQTQLISTMDDGLCMGVVSMRELADLVGLPLVSFGLGAQFLVEEVYGPH